MQKRTQRSLSLVFCVCALLGAPISLPGQVGDLSAKAQSLLGNQPIVPGAAYPTVLSLPGSPFHPVSYTTVNMVEQLAHSSTGTVKLPPGDYSIPIRLLCTSVHVANTQHGLSYHMVPLEGQRAPVLIPLLSRAPAANIQYQPLQTLVWQMEGGLTYNALPPESKQLVDQLIPEYRDQLNEDFLAALQKKCSATNVIVNLADQLSGRHRLNSCPQEVQSAIQQYQAVRQALIQESSSFDALSRQLVTVLPNEAQNVSPTMWSRINSRVYARIPGGHVYGERANLQLRVLPSQTSTPTANGDQALLRREALTHTEDGTPSTLAQGDSADVPLEAMLSYPNDASLLQALGWVMDSQNTQEPGTGYALALKIVPVPSTYMLINSTELSSLQQYLPSGTWLGMGVADTALFSPSYVALADRLLNLLSDLADAVQSFDELGTIGLAKFTSQQLWSLNPQSPPYFVVTAANSIIAATTEAQETLLKKSSCAVATGAQYVPMFIAGPGQYLVVLVMGLSSDPSSASLESLANVVYGFSVGLGQCGQYPNTTIGFQVTEVTVSESVESATTTSCPTVVAASIDDSGNTRKTWNITLPCSALQQSPMVKPTTMASQTKGSVTQPKKPVADETIIENINNKLLAHPLLKSREILVTSRKGTVTLAGTVNAPSEKTEAERIAKGTNGVQRVVNQLTVSASSD